MWGDDFADTTFSDHATTSIVSSLPPFSGSYRPVERLGAFSGSGRAGTWKLKVSDLRARYSGQLEGWSLDLVSCADSTSARLRAGAPDPPPLPEGVPAEAEPVEGRLITVTTTSDMSNGDVSTVEALETNPGPDGISLREAIEATNNDPGTYTAHFDASLTGATIGVDNALPLLAGGGVFIDGDIDGDGRPDVTLEPARVQPWGLNLASSGNRLHALALRGFGLGVVFTAMRDELIDTPLLKDHTFARNVVSGLVLGGTAAPIAVAPTYGHQECEPARCRTRSRWLDTRLVGNTIDSRRDGVRIGWHFDNGDTMRRVTVAGNHIDLGGERSAGANGVDLTVGTSRSSDNRISDALVAYNTIEMGGGINAVQVLAGQGGRSGNVVEDVRVVGNRVRFTGAQRFRIGGGTGGTEGVAIFVSDDCWPSGTTDCRNVVRRIAVVGNVLEGPYLGVRVGEPCCNVIRRNTLTDVRVAANVIEGVIAAPAEHLNPWGVVIGGLGRPGVTKVSIDSNTIVQRVVSPKAGSAGNLVAGGIAVIGGLGKGVGPEQDTLAPSSVRRVSVTNNRVSTKLIGILLLGGGPSGQGAGQDPALGNRVSRVTLRGNVITRAPVLATRWFPRIKGISLIGGLAGPARPNRRWKAVRNSVTCVTLRRNVVAGRGRGVAVLPNLGAGASRNVARLGGC